MNTWNYDQDYLSLGKCKPNHSELPLHTQEDVTIKSKQRKKITTILENVEKMEILCTVDMKIK